MSESTKQVVSIRCVCGKKYRIRNAFAGFRTQCPDCGSTVAVTAADLETAYSADGVIELHAEQEEAKLAIPLDEGTLQLASKGARPGLNAGVAYSNEEAMLRSAMGGRPLDSFGVAGESVAEAEWEATRRSFSRDLLASFYFAGSRHNLIHVSATAAGFSIFFVVGAIAVSVIPLFIILVFPIWLFAYLYVIQYFWHVLTATAAGEDRIPWIPTDWNLWHDALKPLIWMMVISFLCSLPALWVHWYAPASLPYKPLMFWALLVAGWLFWPVAVMSVALGNSILFIRPDWLVRCVVGIGPVYLLAWVLVIGTLVVWWLAARVRPPPVSSSVVLNTLVSAFYSIFLIALNIYLGYVLFRMIGLIFRHFRQRFPWKY